MAKYLGEPSLWNVFIFFILVEGLLCLLGELLRRNVRNVQTENSALQHRESTLMRAIRLNPAEVEGYLRMSRTSDPTEEDVDRLFEMLTSVSQQNLINVVRTHIRSKLTGCAKGGGLAAILEGKGDGGEKQQKEKKRREEKNKCFPSLQILS